MLSVQFTVVVLLCLRNNKNIWVKTSRNLKIINVITRNIVALQQQQHKIDNNPIFRYFALVFFDYCENYW